MSRAKTYVTDPRHFLTKEGAIAPMPPAAQRLAEFLGEVVVYVTTLGLDRATEHRIRCRKRRGRSPCVGEIEADLEDTETIVWWCPVGG